MKTDEHGDVLVHMLGLESGGGRDYYCADGTDSTLVEMERLGLVRRLKPSKILADGDMMFVSTEAGRVLARKRWAEIRPAPPTKAQQRYRRYLSASDSTGCSFREFLTDPYFAEWRNG